MQGQFMTWRNAILSAIEGIGIKVIGKLPDVLAAILVLFIGLFLAGLLGRLVRRMIEFTRLDSFLHDTVGLSKLKDRGLEIHAAALVAWCVKWFFIVVTFIAVADILKWGQLTSFFEQVALYIPNVIITVLILLAGFILGGGLREIVIKSVKASSLPSASVGVIGAFARWSVIAFAIMAALTQLGIAADLIKILLQDLLECWLLPADSPLALGDETMQVNGSINFEKI